MALRDRAKAAVQSNPIMENREKITLDEVIAKFPNGVTLRECAILHDNTNNSDYVACVIDELKDRFFFGGVAVLGLIERIIEEYDTEEEFKEDLENEGLPIVFSKKRSKNGRIYTSVTVL